MRRLLSLAAAVAVMTGALAVPSSVGAFSTNGACPSLKVSIATIEFGPGYWTPGTHTYAFRYVDALYNYSQDYGPWTFTVSDGATLYPGNVMMPNVDFFGGFLSLTAFMPDMTINPAQGTFMHAGWVWDMTGLLSDPPTPPYTMAQAKAELAVSPIYFSWDDGPWVLGNQGPLTNNCVGAWGVPNVPATGTFHRTWGKKF